MKRGSAILLASLIGLFCGGISAETFFEQSWTALIFWALAGIAVGLTIGRDHASPWIGLGFGFFLTAAFLGFGFHGAPDRIPGFVLFSVLLSVVGALCGFVLVLIGRKISRHA